MKKLTFLILLAGLLPTALGALSGTVVDSTGSHPVWGCLITHRQSGTSVRSDKDGSFKLEIGADPGILLFTVPGYYPRQMRVSGNNIVIRVELHRKAPIRMGKVVVSGKKEERVSVNRVTASQMQRRTANLFSDAMKTIQLMPGVVTGDDFSSLMYVRGGSFYETAAMIDDLYIVNPYLWGGVSSVFNPNMVDSIQFYSGGFPASYGQAMSGILDVEIRNGSTTNTRGFFDLSMTTFEGLIEGPLGKESSYIISLRRTYYDLVASLFIEDREGITFPFFYNLHSKFHFKLGRKTILDSNTLLTYEGMTWTFNDDDAAEIPGANAGSEFHYKDIKLMQSFRLKSALTDKLAFKSTFGYKYNLGDYQFVDIDQPFNLDMGVHELQSRADLDWKAGKALSVETGIYAHAAWWDIDMASTMKTLVEQTNTTNAVYFITNQSTSINNEAWIHFGAYLSAKVKVLPFLQVEAGGRLEYFNITDDLILSPRASLLLELGKKSRLKAATGVFQQYPFYVGDGMALNKDYGNLDLGAERARHYVAGFEQDIGTDMMLRIEGFYKDYDRLVVYDHLRNYVNGAERRAVGFDLFFQKKIGKWIDGWITYSYIKVEDRVTLRSPAQPDRPDYDLPFNTWFSPAHDKRHNISVVVNFTLAENYVLGITLRYSSGAPYTPLAQVIEQNDGGTTTYLPVWGEYNSARMPDYCRLDVKLTTPFFGVDGASFYIQFMNILDRENIQAYTYNSTYSEKKKQISLPMIPVVGFRYEY